MVQRMDVEMRMQDLDGAGARSQEPGAGGAVIVAHFKLAYPPYAHTNIYRHLCSFSVAFFCAFLYCIGLH